jgi:hypothetical protein
VTSEPKVGRAAVRGAAIGFLLVAPAFMTLGLVMGAGALGASGRGLFVGVWGGCGCGAMLAATLCLTKGEARALPGRGTA